MPISRARRIRKGEEPTLEEMPLLEHNLKRYAYRLAERPGVPKDLVDENWDKWVSGNLTYKEAKRIVVEHLMELASPERRYEAKEFLTELDKRQDEEIHRQVENLIYTVRDILEGNEYSDYFEIARDSGLFDQPLRNLLIELEDWKTFIVKKTYVRKYSSLVNDLMDLIGKIAIYLAKHPNAKVGDIVGKYSEILEMQARSSIKVEPEEVEIQLKPIIVKKPKPLTEFKEKAETVEEKKPISATEEVKELTEEVEREEEKIPEEVSLPKTESEAVKLASYLKDLIDKIRLLDDERAFYFVEKLKPLIKKLVEVGGYTNIPELWMALWEYKSLAFPLSAKFGKRSEFAFLKKVKCPLEFGYTVIA